MTFLQKHAAKGQIVTGLLYVDPDAEDLHAHLNTVETPLNTLDEKDTVPGLGRAGQDQRQPALEQSVYYRGSRPLTAFAHAAAVTAPLLSSFRRARTRALSLLTSSGDIEARNGTTIPPFVDASQ